MKNKEITFIDPYGKGYKQMEWSRVKTILIALLVFVNTLLISNIFFNTSQTINIRDEFLNILKDRNITLNTNIDINETFDLYDANISKYGTNTIMKNILGSSELTDLGDGAISYESENGSGIETGGGNFNIKLNNVKYPSTVLDAKTKGDKLLKDMDYIYLTSVDTLQGYILEYTKMMNQTPVYGCDIKMIFGKDNTVTIAGKFFLEAVIREGTLKNISLIDIILKISMDNIKIEEIGLAYMLDDEQAGSLLIPCIYINTGIEKFYFDKNLLIIEEKAKKNL